MEQRYATGTKFQSNIFRHILTGGTEVTSAPATGVLHQQAYARGDARMSFIYVVDKLRLSEDRN